MNGSRGRENCGWKPENEKGENFKTENAMYKLTYGYGENKDDLQP